MRTVWRLLQLFGLAFSNSAQQLTPMTERGNPEFFQVLVCQIRQDGKINVILGKALCVLSETELFEPVRNLLHRGSADIVIRAARPGEQSLPVLAN